MELPSFSKRNYKQLALAFVMSGALVMSCVCANAQALNTHSEDLQALGKEVLEAARVNYAQDPLNTRIQVNLAGLDNRLKLNQCEQHHDLAVQDSLGAGGHVNVSVSCRGANQWAILVPITASIYRKVPVASHNLSLGTLISEQDINTEEREITDLRMGYYLDTQELIGKQIRFAMNPGDTFKTSWVDSPIAIKRGEEVSLEAHVGLIKVITRGTAISDGRLGQQIRVKNNQTDKIVNGRVTAPGRVSTL